MRRESYNYINYVISVGLILLGASAFAASTILRVPSYTPLHSASDLRHSVLAILEDGLDPVSLAVIASTTGLALLSVGLLIAAYLNYSAVSLVCGLSIMLLLSAAILSWDTLVLDYAWIVNPAIYIIIGIGVSSVVESVAAGVPLTVLGLLLLVGGLVEHGFVYEPLLTGSAARLAGMLSGGIPVAGFMALTVLLVLASGVQPEHPPMLPSEPLPASSARTRVEEQPAATRQRGGLGGENAVVDAVVSGIGGSRGQQGARRVCPRLSEWPRLLASEPGRVEECWLGREVYGYRVEAVIGRGGFGLVLRAREKYTGEPAAVKVILPAPVEADGSTVTRTALELVYELERESSSLRELSRRSRYIVALKAVHIDAEKFRLAVARDDPGIYLESPPALIMEYMAGGDLKKLLDRAIAANGADTLRRSRDWARAASAILAAAAEALAAIHAGGYIHGDVKPQNILFTEQPPASPSVLARGLASALRGGPGPLPKLSDLGSATRIGEPVQNITPLYAAPELLLYDALCQDPETRRSNQRCLEPPRADPSLDVYSLGVVALQLLAALGRGELEAWRRSGVLDSPQSTRQLLERLGVEGETADFIARMLSPEPGERPSADEVVRFFRGRAGL
ncbi:hypothetical protein Pyrde_0320 [Pyrodictium delaneyi]|uniref:Protein kinase domain-containing protein n=1 Tax=Pyrodictium delaneyi TaxID=1273541 RepID=A0A0P0N1R9_9CREN|nr:protein kinase [Pyrodictium delaneyi]ALL00370.1 hypothetical protein Pyrde_0320 [Pyrodictium delaneyi]OWJ54424.1 hypothetical protein Pdsh_08125 [Pyrodictium delaneyi]